MNACMIAGAWLWSARPQLLAFFLCCPVYLTIFAVGVFLFFGLWHILAGLFVYFLLPETRGIPLEQVRQLMRIQTSFASSGYDELR